MKNSLSILLLLVLMSGCAKKPEKEGQVVQIKYQGAQIEEGEWVQIDSFRFRHIGKREDAKEVRFPLPSNDVLVDSVQGREFSRDYNPKTIPLYMAKHLDRINRNIPDGEKYEVVNYALLSYKGTLEIKKEDSSNVRVTSSRDYEPRVEVEK